MIQWPATDVGLELALLSRHALDFSVALAYLDVDGAA